MRILYRMVYAISHPFIILYWKIFKPKTYGSRALLLSNDKILLVKNIGQKYWSLPGGMVEKGETPEQCIKRELQEELGLNIKEIDYKLGEYDSRIESKKDRVHIFVINLSTLAFEKQWEIDDVRWFAISEMPKEMSPAGKRRIREFLDGKKDLNTKW